MLRMFLHAKRWGLIAAVCISTFVLSGCIESTFNLAHDSRLPHDMTIPPGFTRDDVIITMDYHVTSEVKFTVRDKNGKKLETLIGKTKGNPVHLKTASGRSDPEGVGYQLVVINGVTELIKDIPYREHANMVQNGHIVALFDLVDDPALINEVLASSKSSKR